MKQLEEQIETKVRETGMLSGRSRVICGLSGGADSVFLFLFLKELSGKMGFALRALHVHHRIRGQEADEDAEYVRALCREQGVPLTIKYRDIPLEAKAKGLSYEEAGREARRECFLEEAEKWLCESSGAEEGIAVALAHHQNDLAESVLFRLARGSGVRGLSPMRDVTPLAERVLLVRPLLDVPRARIEESLLARGIRWREDSSNAGDEAARNRIRHRILPLLEEKVNEGAALHIARTARIAGELIDFVEAEAGKRAGKYLQAERISDKEEALFIREELIRCELPAMQQEILLLALQRALPGMKDVGSAHLHLLRELFEKESGKKLILPCNMAALRDYGGVRLMRRQSADSPGEEAPREVPLPVGGCCIFQKMRFFAELEEGTPVLYPEKRYTETMDYGTIKNTLVVRNRRKGDFLFLRKDGGRKSLSDYFTDEKVPRALRDQVIVIADGSEILWVVGMRLSGRCRITSDTRQALTITAELLQE